MTLVIDASVALTWCFEDERRVETEALGRRVVAETAHVPALFHLEMANILLVGERKGRITPEDSARRLEKIGFMPLLVDEETVNRAWSKTMDLARSERLTSYDAAYLELAIRVGAELATLDAKLADAARRRGVELAL